MRYKIIIKGLLKYSGPDWVVLFDRYKDLNEYQGDNLEAYLDKAIQDAYLGVQKFVKYDNLTIDVIAFAAMTVTVEKDEDLYVY